MEGSISWADLECLEVLWWVERSPYCENFGGLERVGGAVDEGLEDKSLGLVEEDCRPPRVDIDSMVSSSPSGPSSGSESSKTVLRLAGGGR